MASVSSSDKVVSSQSLMVETTAIGTLTYVLPLPTLPFDLIVEIMCRLPVKLLVQLRCLGKSFNYLISDPKFAKKHLRLSIKRHHLIVCPADLSSRVILYDSPISSFFSKSGVTQTQLSYPKFQFENPTNISSCDGILCLTIDDGSAILWNPSIRKLTKLPPFFVKGEKSFWYSAYSFGYDRFTDEYKVFVVSLLNYERKIEVSVHTLGTDYWRRIQDFPFKNAIRYSGIFVSDTVNWLTTDLSKSNCDEIVSLDLVNESYQILSSPDLNRESWRLSMGVLRDCLCLSASSTCDMFFDVWVMKEYGNIDSWTKLYSVSYVGTQIPQAYALVLYISEDDQMVVDFIGQRQGSNKRMVTMYDSKNGTLNILDIQNINHFSFFTLVVYNESLISP
ncbi:putative F-box domain, leucine-rich repeat domain, L domain-containing protein [Medicago truncatula]|uniref:F-box protein interaction domain protein n=1 Tax=Medicago truncatula TaxID=3880 RepID=G7IWQ7_MEDTR|nr:F-box/kelch-repeat protein At3g23880 [Medicago truncatula]AES69470.2 F-box protein interaction domain protein [Medicago truncatula]RHN66258.1 putative F-box domain, leucine-rich repeat domain, L domain-containing protein [Medicago truncatula]